MPSGDIDAIRLLLERLNVSVEDLLEALPERRSAPTFREYVPHVVRAVPLGTRGVYEPYWRRSI